MKLATFVHRASSPKVGVVTDEGLVDLSAIAPSLPPAVIDIIDGGEPMLEEIRRVISRARPIPLEHVRLLAPVPHPPEFLGIGLNYRDHCNEIGIPLPSVPTVFNKQTSCIAGPHDEVVLPTASDQLDYEGELAFIVGRAARRHLSREQAHASIFGYVVVNDVSVRDVQLSSSTVTLGKSFDTHGPLGPWIVTPEEIGDPQQLVISTLVNGEQRQRGNTSDMIFDCADILVFLSRFMSLQPGTVVTTGTPAGVGHCKCPPAYLRAGDRVTVEISGLGRLDNRVVAEAASTLKGPPP